AVGHRGARPGRGADGVRSLPGRGHGAAARWIPDAEAAMIVRPPRRIRRPGHLAMAVPDVGRAADFYTRVVGLAEVQRAGGVAYLRAQFEHHCLELHDSNDAVARRAAPLHFGWETDSDEDTEALRAVLTRAGVPLRPAPAEPGRLGVAFQFQDVLGM